MNQFDQHIPGIDLSRSSVSYIFELIGLENYKIHDQLKKDKKLDLSSLKISMEFQISFLYRNTEKQKCFFFGRTASVPAVELQEDKQGFMGF